MHLTTSHAHARAVTALTVQAQERLVVHEEQKAAAPAITGTVSDDRGDGMEFEWYRGHDSGSSGSEDSHRTQHPSEDDLYVNEPRHSQW